MQAPGLTTTKDTDGEKEEEEKKDK